MQASKQTALVIACGSNLYVFGANVVDAIAIDIDIVVVDKRTPHII